LRKVNLFLAAAFPVTSTTAHAAPARISISRFVEHPALNAVMKGFKDDPQENGVAVEYKDDRPGEAPARDHPSRDRCDLPFH
jgi:ABC-type uncharacterized transport system substrate-binding protein